MSFTIIDAGVVIIPHLTFAHIGAGILVRVSSMRYLHTFGSHVNFAHIGADI